VIAAAGPPAAKGAQMTEQPTSTSAGTTQESGTTGLADGAGEGPQDQPQLSGGKGVPEDRSATADTDHPGLPAGGDTGDDADASGTLADDPQIRAEASQA
jgi:hypothetical protein